MNDENIYKVLLTNKRVNNYTKLLIILNNLNYYKDYYIPNKKLKNQLKIDYKNIRTLLHQLEDDNIIKIGYKGKKRYFKFLTKNEKEKKDHIKLFKYDWLNDED